LQDSVSFGNQLSDFAVGRLPNGSGAFALTVPSRGAANAAAGTGPVSAVKVNEWLADPTSGSDMIELYNTSALPVALGGYFLTDTLSDKTKSVVQTLTFIGGSGSSRWLPLIADNSTAPGHVNFALSKSGEAVGIFSPTGEQIDAVVFGAQTQGVSQGSYPDGSGSIVFMPPSLGLANVFDATDSDGDGMPDVWEKAHGLNSISALDAALDADGDGMSNLAEYLADTDPQSAASRFTSNVVKDSAGISVHFLARAGRGYRVEYSLNLAAGSWQKLVDVPAQALPTEMSIPDPAAGSSPRFYRVITPNP
ncbi:MAG: hypothetical protein JWO82_1131, partial [Akkermansiaceae bacterium]|nr:hypothetical protein [Akkermansiaceae bacterium]